MMIRHFSSVLRGVLALGSLGLALAGCGDDDPSCDGVLRDGTCYATCDEALDCTSTPGGKCVAYTDPADGVVHDEGRCFAACTETIACGAGNVCAVRTSLKGEAVTVCQSRPIVGLPEGKPGEACTDNLGCDEGAGLVCREDGTCGLPPAEQGGACGDQQGCVDGLVCFQGSCQTASAGPGEGCGQVRPCQASEGLACNEGRCFYGCNTFDGCAAGYSCQQMAAADNGFVGVCRPQTSPNEPGQYGTACPVGNECADGFTCVRGDSPGASYCAKTDGCQTDTECPSGYWCGTKTNISSDGKTIDFANPIRVCRKREFCSPCETDLDCSLQTGAVCVPDADGEKFCSLPCNVSKNSCVIGAGCVEVDRPDGSKLSVCRPDVGVCHAKGEPTGCEPCRIDGDCGPNALCANGSIGSKPGMRWCQTPCGEPDADGKRPCPVAPNGLEMMCLDETLSKAIGGPIAADDTPLYAKCVRPLSVENTAVGTKDPANNVCGDGKRQADEECDDANSSPNDGCDACKIVDTCRFTLGPVVAPGKPATLLQGGKTLTEIPAACSSFRVEGTIANAGDVAEFRMPLPDGAYTWLEVASGGPNQCTTDLVATVQTGDYDAATDTLDITNKSGAITGCADLTNVIKNLDAAKPALCPGNVLGCGSCTDKGLCGVCDDDSGIGNCPRLLLSSTTSVQGYKVKFASTKQQVRISARDPQASGVTFVATSDRLTNSGQSPKFPPALTCY